MTRARSRTAHAELDQLRQQTAAERVKARDLEAKLEAAKAEVEQASRAIADAYAAGDQRAVTKARKADERAVAKARDVHHRLNGAELRAERAQRSVDAFTTENADRLLKERERTASEVAQSLTRTVHEVIGLHRRYLQERQEIQDLVNVIEPGQGQRNGPPASHPWERALKDLEHAVRQSAELPASMPRWHGLADRQREDAVNAARRQARQQTPGVIERVG